VESAGASSFQPPHASFEQIEELMSVNGITPELFHGGYQRDAMGGLILRPGLRDCLSVYSSGKGMDVNTASPAVMLALGAPPSGVEQLVQLRARRPLLPDQMGTANELLGPAAGGFQIGGDHIYTLRATARLRRPDGSLSDLRRSVSMTVQVGGKNLTNGYQVLAWQDYAVAPPVFKVWPN
jgi:general secretion pathway protein K